MNKTAARPADQQTLDIVSLLTACEQSFAAFLFIAVNTIEGPIPRYKYIADLAHKLQSGESLLIEKSRQMTVSWILCAFQVWQLLFQDNTCNFICSLKEEDVDNKTWRSLFGKMDLIIANLPEWIDTSFLERKHLVIRNAYTNGMLLGHSSSPKGSRGGTYTGGFIDEVAFIENADEIIATLFPACHGPINVISTPFGQGNWFYQERMRIVMGESRFKLVTLHYSQHPLRDRKWFEEVTKGMPKDKIAREYEIDYRASLSGLVFGSSFSPTKHVTDKIDWEPGRINITGWDFGIVDATTFFLGQVTSHGELLILGEYENNGMTIEHYLPVLKKKITYARDLIKRKAGDRIESSDLDFSHWGDKSGSARNAQGRSWFSSLRSAGIDIKPANRRISVQDGINYMRMMFENNRILIHPRCGRIITCLENYAWGKNEKPVHNEFSHMMDAVRYGITSCDKLCNLISIGSVRNAGYV